MEWANIDNWCRVCGCFSASIVVEGELEVVITELLQIKVSDKLLCFDCTTFLQEISYFKTKANEVQEMFEELQKIESSPEHLNLVRINYGLDQGVLESYIADETAIKEEEISNICIKHEIEEGIQVSPSLEDDCLSIEECIEESREENGYLESEEPKQKQYPKKVVKKTENEKLYEFKCHICSLEFPKMQMLSTHCRSHSPETLPKVLCPWCGVALNSWKRCMAHKSKHIRETDDFICRLCNVSYKKKSAYDKHLTIKHGPGAVRFICSQCGKEFKERNILKNHEKIHLPDELKLKHPCIYCGKKFVNGHCLKIHIARVHEKVALHTCELCGKGCITKSDLKWHMDKHVEERNYECEICNLKFKSTNSLRIHKRRHFNQDKKIVCPICSKEFFSSAALSNHKLVHSEVKRYKCFCGNEYKRLESYKCHVNSTHTGERPFSCMWCSRTFVNSANCRKHKLKDHPLEVAKHEAVHGKKGVSLAMKTALN